MNDSTTIKVPRALRDRLAVRARQQHSTLAAAIETALDASEEREFWTRVRSENAALTDEERRVRLHGPAAADNLRNPVDDALSEDDW
jgi:predicted transcriptional regulator